MRVILVILLICTLGLQTQGGDPSPNPGRSGAVVDNIGGGKVVPKKCMKSYCDSLFNIHINQVKPKDIGNDIMSQVGSNNVVTVGAYTEIPSESLIQSTADKNLAQCCKHCAALKNCAYFMFFIGDITNKQIKKTHSFREHNKKCYLVATGDGKKKFADKRFLPPISEVLTDTSTDLLSEIAIIGGGDCTPTIEGEPHLVGAHGTPYDFNGRLESSHALITDKDFHVNVVMRGYELPESPDHPRTWIEEVGLVWNYKGARHSIRMDARRGKEQSSGAQGFLSAFEIDGAPVAREYRQPGEVLEWKKLGLTLTFLPTEKVGYNDVDHFVISIKKLATVDVRMRVALPLFQTENEAHAHFDLRFTRLENTPAIHGVLGQTFRETDEQYARAEKYSQLSAILKKPVDAEGETGKGFLDGSTEDYITPHVLSTACTFCSFV